MKGTVNGVMYSGTRDLTIVEIQLEGNQAEAVEKFKGMHVDVSLKQFKRRRSLDANRYYWTLIGKLRYVTGQPKSDIYKDHVRDVGGNYSIACVADKDVDRLCRNWQRNGTPRYFLLNWRAVPTSSCMKGQVFMTHGRCQG